MGENLLSICTRAASMLWCACREAYEQFLRPTLLVGLFAPPENISAAVMLETLYFYALAHQNDFGVCCVCMRLCACLVRNSPLKDKSAQHQAQQLLPCTAYSASVVKGARQSILHDYICTEPAHGIIVA